eukprot:scaffold12.g8042.t1
MARRVKFGLTQGASKRKQPASGFDDDSDSSDDGAAAQKPEELQRLGDEAAAGSRWAEALRHWGAALHAAPPPAPAVECVLHEQMAQVYLENGLTWKAVQSAARAVELRPAWAAARLTLGRAQLALGEPELALSSLEAALQLEPENAEAGEEAGAARALVARRAAAGGPAGRRLTVREPAAGGGGGGGGVAGPASGPWHGGGRAGG